MYMGAVHIFILLQHSRNGSKQTQSQSKVMHAIPKLHSTQSCPGRSTTASVHASCGVYSSMLNGTRWMAEHRTTSWSDDCNPPLR